MKIGVLYRYPHPQDPARFVYVGQGPKRDWAHRNGKSSFGRRFQSNFPKCSLPQPIFETVSVANQIELNELETIAMFRYHTWHGYVDGMNLLFPGGLDYERMGRIGGTVTVERSIGVHALGVRQKAGKAGGRTSARLKVGAHAPGIREKGGRRAAIINRAAKVGLFSIGAVTPETRLRGSRAGVHAQFHFRKPSVRCDLCSEQSLIIPFA